MQIVIIASIIAACCVLGTVLAVGVGVSAHHSPAAPTGGFNAPTKPITSPDTPNSGNADPSAPTEPVATPESPSGDGAGAGGGAGGGGGDYDGGEHPADNTADECTECNMTCQAQCASCMEVETCEDIYVASCNSCPSVATDCNGCD